MAEVSGVASKHAKYQTGNPISRYLVQNFLRTIERLVEPIAPTSILDVGCGEGVVLSTLAPRLQNARVCAVDADPVEVEDAQANLPFAEVQVADVHELPFEDESFDLVMCCEVLEHVERPYQALRELKRVSSRFVLVSVPREPIWRALNMARGSYWGQLGNTPGHINHWSGSSFATFVSRELRVLDQAQPLPWTVVCSEKI